MDITKLDEYEGVLLQEAIEWAKAQRGAGKFKWDRRNLSDDPHDPIPFGWTTCEGTTHDDHLKMVKVADFYQEIKWFKKKCHAFFKGHSPKWEGDGEGGTRCTVCMEKLVEADDYAYGDDTIGVREKD